MKLFSFCKLSIFALISVLAVSLICATPARAAANPPGATTGAVAVSITPYLNGFPTSGPVHVGDQIVYGITLSMPYTGEINFNFFGGTVAVRLPNSASNYIPVAGLGAATPAAPTIPEITKDTPFFFKVPFTYTVSASDLVLNNGKMRLVAYVDYGVPEFPASLGGVSGTFENGDPNGVVGAHAGTINGLDIATPTATQTPPVEVPEFGFIPGVIALLSSGGTFLVLKKRTNK